MARWVRYDFVHEIESIFPIVPEHGGVARAKLTSD